MRAAVNCDSLCVVCCVMWHADVAHGAVQSMCGEWFGYATLYVVCYVLYAAGVERL
jgi:hypothetical protein